MTSRTLPYQKFPRHSVLGAACVLLAACGGSSETRPTDDGAPSFADAKLQLTRATSCDDLLDRIQSSIIAQLTLRAQELKTGEDAYYYGPGIALGGGTATVDEEAAAPRDASDAPSGAPTSGGSDNSAAPPAQSPRPQNPTTPSASPDVAEGDGATGEGGFSGTTRQVEDVDEADIVKTDGDRIYLLHGGTLFVLQGWPANATQILGSTLVEGQPTEMFVSDGKAVVFSRVYGDLAGQVRGAGDAPVARYDYGSSYTKISVLDVSEAAPRLLRESFVEGDYTSARRHGSVVRAVIQDGFKIPRLDAPSIEYRDAFGQPFPQRDIDAQVDAWLDRTARSILATDLGDWLPREFTREGSSTLPVAPRCADYYSPDAGLTENGVTSVVALDLGEVSAALSGATILGRAERVYANDSALLITQTDYRYTYDAGATEQTIIHRFEIADGTTYTASGAVAGRVNDQFSLDERDGIIRVSVTEQPQGRFGIAVPAVSEPAIQPTPSAPPPSTPMTFAGEARPAASEAVPEAPAPEDDAPEADAPEADAEELAGDLLVPNPAIAPAPNPVPGPQVPVSRVLTLGTAGDTLAVLGQSQDFGHTERIFATRFIGDRGYVVTFRQTDPLFVLDLSDPADPRVVGELHIPGFSNFLFPLDADHLFAIGRDATAEGFTQGLALQVFDVSDPTQPALSAKYVYADVGDSPANIDHRAISFHPDRNVVAFPHQSYQTGESTLDVFQISNTSIAPLGGVAMTTELDLDVCITNYFGPQPQDELPELRAALAANPEWQREVLASCRYGNSFRRGLFRDDFVYGISNTGVLVYDLTQLGAGAVGEVTLPAEVYQSVNYGGGTSGGSAGARPTPAVDPIPDELPSPGAPSNDTDGGSDSAGAGGAAGAGE